MRLLLLSLLLLQHKRPPRRLGPNDAVYPQGYRCDPLTGIFYDIVTLAPTGCVVDRETGIIACANAGGLPGAATNVVVQIK